MHFSGCWALAQKSVNSLFMHFLCFSVVNADTRQLCEIFLFMQTITRYASLYSVNVVADFSQRKLKFPTTTNVVADFSQRKLKFATTN